MKFFYITKKVRRGVSACDDWIRSFSVITDSEVKEIISRY